MCRVTSDNTNAGETLTMGDVYALLLQSLF